MALEKGFGLPKRHKKRYFTVPERGAGAASRTYWTLWTLLPVNRGFHPASPIV
jgi:hypothetical protein